MSRPDPYKAHRDRVDELADACPDSPMLRMDGYENVRLLYGGYNEWKARDGLEAFARASKKS